MTSSDPAIWNRTIYRGTDHRWIIRRVDSTGTPQIPTAARAQIRNVYGGEIWLDCVIDIDPIAGWITILIPEDATSAADWDKRAAGIWDLNVDSEGERLRWVQGRVTVSQAVTRETS